jgi:hypothetical protein
MSNKSCGPDVVKYFIVTPLTGDTYVIGGVNTPATNNTNSALINLIYNQGIPFGTYSLPYTDTYVTGATYSNGTAVFTNNLGDSFNLTGLSTGYTLTSSGISTALGYTPLSAFTDTFITGITYSNNNIIVGRNQGQSSLTTNISTMTGLTVNGNLTVTGNTSLKSTTATTLNISSTPTTDTGTTLNYLTRDGSTGEVKVKTIPEPTVYGLFTQTSDSATVSATTVETTIVGSGIGGLSVPANTFKIGDSFQASLDGDISCINTATIHIHVITSGGIILMDTGVINLNTATNSHWFLNLFFTIRQIGGATVASISSGGIFSYVKDSAQTYEGFPLSQVNNTTFDTTILNSLDVTVTWNTNNSGNKIFSRNFTLTKIF